MELRHLRYFVTVAETLNFRKAAKQLNMTQPPLSQQIQQIEHELGVELFDRRGRSIVLTAAGTVFLKDAYHILDLTDRMIRRTRQAARGELGQLHIGFVGSAAYQLLPRVLQSFRERFSEVEIVLSEMTSEQQLQALAEARIDLGLCRISQEYVQDHLQVKTVVWEPLCAVLPRQHRLAGQTVLNLADLAEEPFILFPQHLGKHLYQSIKQACETAGFTPQVTQEATHISTIVGLVAAGLGVSVLPGAVMASPHAHVTYRPLLQALPVPLSAVWREDKASPVCENFLNILLSHAEPD